MMKRLVMRLLNPVRRVFNGDLRRGAAPWTLNDNYVDAAPSAQQTVDLFAGDWASALPLPGATSGTAALFDDVRITFLIERLGGVAGMDVLELGPLEAGHTTMLERAGAAKIDAIDANKSAYLKCLVVQQLLGLKAANFMLGDFDAFMDGCQRRYDVLLASGILYHMPDPLRTLRNMVRLSDRIFIWSHFIDDVAMPQDDRRRRPMTGEHYAHTIGDDTLTYHVRSYRGTEGTSAFCGGLMSRAIWLERNEVISFFERNGYAVEIAFEEPGAPSGPAMCLLATKN